MHSSISHLLFFYNKYVMTKTQIQKVFAAIALFAIATTNFGAVSAADIGTGSVVGSGAFDSAIVWDDNLPGFATGSVTDILIKARVEPSLNMVISTGSIDLGVLAPNIASTGNLAIEIGTNAANGVSITARSQSGGLTNTSDTDIQINTLTPLADPVASESYTWGSTIGTSDSSFGTFVAVNTGANGLNTAQEITETVTEYNVYTSNKPEATDGIVPNDVTFTVSATAQAQTPAGDYEDRVTFTVVGNF